MNAATRQCQGRPAPHASRRKCVSLLPPLNAPAAAVAQPHMRTQPGSAHAPDARGAALGTGRRSKWAVSCLRTAAKAPVSAGVQDPRRPAPSIPKMGIAALLRVDDRAAAAGDG